MQSAAPMVPKIVNLMSHTFLPPLVDHSVRLQQQQLRPPPRLIPAPRLMPQLRLTNQIPLPVEMSVSRTLTPLSGLSVAPPLSAVNAPFFRPAFASMNIAHSAPAAASGTSLNPITCTAKITTLPKLPPKTGESIAPPCQMLMLPESVSYKLDMQQPLVLKLGGQKVLLQPSAFVKTSEGVKVCLPEGLLPQNLFVPKHSAPSSTRTNRPNGATAVALQDLCPQKNVAIATNSQTEHGHIAIEAWTVGSKISDCTDKWSLSKAAQLSLSSSPVIAVDSPCPTTICRTSSGVKAMKMKEMFAHCYMLHSGFDSMLHILRYLGLSDLLRVSQVSRTWNELVFQPCLVRVLIDDTQSFLLNQM